MNNKTEENQIEKEITNNNNINNFNSLNIKTKTLTLLGSLLLIKKSINFSFWLKKYFYLKDPKNFVKEYGNGWTVITGASDGLGKSYAKNFYSKGNNLLLISHNEEKLKSTIEELRKNNTQKNHIEYLVYDFSEDYFQENLNFLGKNLEKYEINILINNVGRANLNYFEKISAEEIIDSVNLNVFSSVFLTKIVLKKMKKRRIRSLIVFIGSDLVDYSPPYLQIYTACKSFNFSLCKSLIKESGNNKVDFSFINPGPLETSSNKRRNFFKLNTDEFASKSICHFGRYENSYGHYLFAIKNSFFGNEFIRKFYTDKSLKKEFNPHNNINKL